MKKLTNNTYAIVENEKKIHPWFWCLPTKSEKTNGGRMWNLKFILELEEWF